MSKKRRRMEESKPAAEAVVQTTTIPEAHAGEELTEQLFNIEEAAKHFIAGFHARWLPGIQAHASSHGMTSLHTEGEWKAMFLAWGASLK